MKLLVGGQSKSAMEAVLLAEKFLNRHFGQMVTHASVVDLAGMLMEDIDAMARISEASYRRGYQHGVERGHLRAIEPAEFRYEYSLDQSPDPDGDSGCTSTERLYMQFPELGEALDD
jgi:hypothetical protein